LFEGEESLPEHSEFFEDRPYLDNLGKEDLLLVDDNTYINKKFHFSKLQTHERYLYNSKLASLRSWTMERVLKEAGRNKKALWEYIKPEQIKPTFPNYPHCIFKNGKKQVAAVRINKAYRTAGHFHPESKTLFLFWVDTKKCAIYNH